VVLFIDAFVVIVFLEVFLVVFDFINQEVLILNLFEGDIATTWYTFFSPLAVQPSCFLCYLLPFASPCANAFGTHKGCTRLLPVEGPLAEQPETQVRAIAMDFLDVQNLKKLQDFISHYLSRNKNREPGWIRDYECGADQLPPVLHFGLTILQLNVLALFFLISEEVGFPHSPTGDSDYRAERVMKMAEIREWWSLFCKGIQFFLKNPVLLCV
jgi:hypothetical protein